MKGEWFEVKTAALLYLRGIKGNLEFRLGTNIEQARNFDDIVLQYRTRDPGSQWHTCFIQLKHKERARLDTYMLISNDRGGFSLQKYLKSFCDIKTRISTGSDHHLFRGPFDTCYFVIYTNAPMVRELALRQRNTTAGLVTDLLKTSQREEAIVEFSEEADGDIYRALKVSGGPEAAEFLRKLTVFAGQPSEDQMDALIKDELRVTCSDHKSEVDVLYRFFIEAVRQWWSEDDVNFLTHDSSLLEKALDQFRVFRISSQEKLLYRLDVLFVDASLESLTQPLSLSRSVYFIHCVNVPAELGCTKVMQVLRQMRGAYTFVSLHRFGCMRDVVLHGWMEGEQPYLVVFCNTAADHTDLWEEVTSLLMENMCKHLVVVFHYESFPTTLRKILMETGVTYMEIHEHCKLSDLNSESVQKIGESKLILQGKTTTLRTFLGDSLEKAGQIIMTHLVSFLGTVTPSIGKEPPSFPGREPRCYLERYDYMKLQILCVEMTTGVIAVSNATPTRLRNLPPPMPLKANEKPRRCWIIPLPSSNEDDFVEDSVDEEEFKHLCELHETVHWVTYNDDGYLKWRQSKGDIRTIHFFADRTSWTVHRPYNTMDLNDKVVIITHNPAYGEPSLVHYLGMETKRSYPHYWVLIIPLQKHIPLLKETPMENCDPIEFLVAATGMSRRHQLQADLFAFSVTHAGNVVVVLDGFEQIPTQCQVAVKDLIQKMTETTILQVVVSTSWYTSVMLEHAFTTLAYYRKRIELLKNISDVFMRDRKAKYLELINDAKIFKVDGAAPMKTVEKRWSI